MACLELKHSRELFQRVADLLKIASANCVLGTKVRANRIFLSDETYLGKFPRALKHFYEGNNGVCLNGHYTQAPSTAKLPRNHVFS
jgi:hypothetical protein